MPTIQATASLQLDWIIVGGGLSGLATAYVLRKAGHRVRVLEKLQKLDVPAAGLRVPPNLSKIFKDWIGEEELSRISVRNVGTPWYDLVSGERVGYHHWTPAVMKETGGDFLMMHHEDVHKMLYRLAVEAGVTVELGVEVVAVEAGQSDESPEPRVVLASGQVYTADLVVGADGPTSIVRQTAFDIDDTAEPVGVTVLGGIIPADAMLKDPDWSSFVLADEWPIFMGPRRSLCCHPVRAKKEFSVQLFWPNDEAGPDNVGPESWYEVIPTTSIDFTPYAPSIQRLLAMVPFLTRTRFMKRAEELENWSDDSGRIVLIGEAAHPWFPGGSHISSMVVEDAVVFGTLFSHLSDHSQIGSFLSAYQELREARTKVVKQEDITNAQLVMLPYGPDRDARNANMAPLSRTDDWDEGILKRELDVFAEIFCYEAEDAAEEWWVDWGRFSQRAKGQQQQSYQDDHAADAGTHQQMGFMYGAVTSVTGHHSDDEES